MDEELVAQFGTGAKAAWSLHPPVMRALGMKRKLRLGSWFRPAFTTLHRLRRLRGSPFDPFGRAHVRKVERDLVTDYLAVVGEIADSLTPDNHAVCVELASLPDMVRGYEQIKLASVESYRTAQSGLLDQLRAHPASPSPEGT